MKNSSYKNNSDTTKYIRVKNDINCRCGNCNKTWKDDVNAFFMCANNPEMIMCDTCLGTTIGTSLTNSVYASREE